MAPTASTPLADVFSVGKRSLTAWKQVSACEQVGCTLGRLLFKALSWLAKGAGELSSWLWQASGAAYLLEIVLGALKIIAIGVGAVLITSCILLIAIRTVLWVASVRRKRREAPRYTPAPRGRSGETPPFHTFSAASFGLGGFASFRTSPSANYGTCSDSTSWAFPPQGTNPSQQFTTPTKWSSVTFQKWYRHTQTCRSDKSGLQEFPYPPVTSCSQCEDQKNEGQPCHHAIAEFF